MDPATERRLPPPPWRIEGKRLYLRDLRPADAYGPYLAWMNDPEVVRFTESRFCTYRAADLESYIGEKIAGGDCLFLAIVVRDEDRHIGNVKIGPVDWHHGLADLGIIIGDKGAWGRGYASEAIALVTGHCFAALGLHKITAGCYAPNAGAIRSFEKAGYAVEAVRPRHCRFEGDFVDVVLLGRIDPAHP